MKDVDFFTPGARLALELECLLLDTRDTAAVSKWWDSAHEALEQWRQAVRDMEAADAALSKEMSMTDRYKKIRAVLTAAPAAQKTYPQMMPAELRQFLSDVMTAAGLVSHGKQCKALGERLGDACMRLHLHYPEPFVAIEAALEALKAENEALRAEVEQVKADLMESDEIREKLGHLLTRTAAALKGEPPEGVWHSWHDLPEKAAQLAEALKKVAQSLEWYAHGRCRGFDDEAPLPTNEAVELAERTLAKVRA